MKRYVQVNPEVLLVASGAREKSAFPGNTLPGVYGAGAFQTLVNPGPGPLRRPPVHRRRRERRPDRRIPRPAGRHPRRRAGRSPPECSGYKVHKDAPRFGVPICTPHRRERQRDGRRPVRDDRRPRQGLEGRSRLGEILRLRHASIAIGLDPVDEFYDKAGVRPARLRGRRRRGDRRGFGRDAREKSAAWKSSRPWAGTTADLPGLVRNGRYLEVPAGKTVPEAPPEGEMGFSGPSCVQEIPCDPCTTVCPRDLIHIHRATSAACRPLKPSTRPGPAPAAKNASRSVPAWPSFSSITARIPPLRPSRSCMNSQGWDRRRRPVRILDTEAADRGRSRSSASVRSKPTTERFWSRPGLRRPSLSRIAGIRVQDPAAGNPWTASSSGRPTTSSSAAASGLRPERSGPHPGGIRDISAMGGSRAGWAPAGPRLARLSSTVYSGRRAFRKRRSSTSRSGRCSWRSRWELLAGSEPGPVREGGDRGRY